MHANWAGVLTGGLDVALLRLSGPSEIPNPVLADPRIVLYPNIVVYGLTVGAALESSQPVVVRDELCGELAASRIGFVCVDLKETSGQPGTLSERTFVSLSPSKLTRLSTVTGSITNTQQIPRGYVCLS